MNKSLVCFFQGLTRFVTHYLHALALLSNMIIQINTPDIFVTALVRTLVIYAHVYKSEIIHRRLLELIGTVPPAEAEEQYYIALDEPVMAS